MVRAILILVAFGAYALVHGTLTDTIGRSGGLFMIVPAALAVTWFRYKGALVTLIIGFPLNVWISGRFGSGELVEPSAILTFVIASIALLGLAITRDIIERGRSSVELLQLAFRAAQDGLWDYYLDSGTVYFSPRWYEMLGYAADEFEPAFDNWANLIHPDDRDDAVGAVQRCIETNDESFAATFRMRTKTDNWTWILSRGHIVERDRMGRPIRLVGVHSDVSELKRAEADLVHMAFHDQLTGLPNRKALYERGERALVQATRAGDRAACALMLIDLDNFKHVNDSLGHDVGDELIRAAGARLGAGIRASDMLFRLGGDEFVVLLTGLYKDQDAAVVADTLRRAFAESFEIGVNSLVSTVSIGIAPVEDDGVDIGHLLRRADTALYSAKTTRNRSAFFTARMQRAADDRLAIVSGLRAGLSGDAFELHYQPIVTAEGIVVAAEALIRWRRTPDELVSPAGFIEIAEETGLIVPLGRWVMLAALRELSVWRERGHTDISMHINLAPQQVREVSLVDDLMAAIAASGVPADRVGLELTERGYLEAGQQGATRIAAIRGEGVSIALDDFGVGYSSFEYIRRLDVDAIKLDRTFVMELPANDRDATIARVICQMARTLGLDLVAEGVETAAQAESLAHMLCPHQQGYHWARPLPSAAIRAMLDDGVVSATPVP